MSPTQPQALLFDLGGVVFDISFDRCFRVWAEASGSHVSHIKANFAFDEAYAAHECARLSGEDYGAHVCKTLGLSMPLADFERGWNDIYIGPIAETVRFLREMQCRTRLFAFTNSNLLHRKVWMQRFKDELLPFERVFCSSQLQLRKPDAAAFAKIVDEIGVGREHIVIVDDLSLNVEAARSFGMMAVLFSNAAQAVRDLRQHFA